MKIQIYTDGPDPDGWYVGRVFDPSSPSAVADIHMYDKQDINTLKQKLRLLGWRFNGRLQKRCYGYEVRLRRTPAPQRKGWA